MTLRPSDMLQIQSAIDEYEKKYPRRPEPTAEQALAWRLGTRGAVKFLEESGDSAATASPEREIRRFRLGRFLVQVPRLDPAVSYDVIPAVRGVVRLGWWSMLGVTTISIFLLGAFVGGFK